MKQLLVFITVIVLLGAGAGAVFWLQNQKEIDVPKFSKYASSSPALIEKSKRDFELVALDVYGDVSTSTGYPSHQLDDEIDYLLTLVSNRNNSDKGQLENLLSDSWQISVSGGTLSTLVTPTGRIYTKELIDMMWSDIEKVVATEQLLFDVARPTQIDVRVNSPLLNLETPSFPSELAAKLQVLNRLFESLEYKDSVFSEASEQAVNDLLVYGVNTRPDIEYAQLIANGYYEKLKKHPNYNEFIELLRDREWGRSEVAQIAEGPLPDVVITNQFAEPVSQGIIFKTKIANLNDASTPAKYPVSLEVDIYGDGSVDIREHIEAVQLYGKTSSEISYFRNINRTGEHKFRFVIDPNWEMPETRKLNNIGSWVDLSI